MDTINQQKWYYKCVGCGKQDQVTCDNCRRDVFVNVNDLALRCANCKTEIRRVTHVCQRETGEAIWDKEEITTFNEFALNRDVFFTETSKVKESYKPKTKPKSYPNPYPKPKPKKIISKSVTFFIVLIIFLFLMSLISQ